MNEAIGQPLAETVAQLRYRDRHVLLGSDVRDEATVLRGHRRVVHAAQRTDRRLDAPCIDAETVDSHLRRDARGQIRDSNRYTLASAIRTAGAEPWAACAAVAPRSLAFGASAGEVRAVEGIVTAEVDGYLTWLRGTDVAPTVAALRARADEVVATELLRFNQRRPDLTEEQRADIAHAVHRIVQRLLHAPTVRVRELAAGPGGEAYAAALRELFDLYVPDEIDPVRAGEVGRR